MPTSETAAWAPAPAAAGNVEPVAFLFIAVIAFLVSGLTLFSGFGLGTLLLPAFSLLFPVEVAVAATAVVHALNGLFKSGLLYRHAVPRILLRFGIPAVAAAFLGAFILTRLSTGEPLHVWSLGGRQAAITPIKLVMGGLILLFAAFELVPRLHNLKAPPRWLPLGGLLSGFFGGLSGHQGALRAAFLLPLGLEPAAFVGTQALLATMVDTARLLVYGAGFFSGRMAGVSTPEQWKLVAVATLAAFAGAYTGRRLLPKVTLSGLRFVAGGLLLLVGIGLLSGLI